MSTPTSWSTTPSNIINDPDLSLDRLPGNIFIVTMRKAPENRIDSAYAQKLMRTYNLVRETIGPGENEGAVITRGNDKKFWCTVRFAQPPKSTPNRHPF